MTTSSFQLKTMFKRLSKKRDREQADEESGVKAIKDMLALGGEDEVSGESDSESESEASDEEDEQDSVSGSDDDEDEGQSDTSSCSFDCD